MSKVFEKLPEIKLVGITARTTNLEEMNPTTAQIGATMQRFFREDLQDRIFNRKNPTRVFAVYTDYESDEHGEYTYFLGEEVTSFEKIADGFQTLVIPSHNYIKFTSNPGIMPQVVIDMWQNIWTMDALALGGQRAYIADFEIYDERSTDPHHAVVDIYVGLK